MIKITGITLLLLVSLMPAVQASNLSREYTVAAEIRQSLRQGEAMELTAGNRQFLAIFQKSERPVTRGGVIILHGIEQNPDSPGVVRTLRTKLTDSGWDTLSVQMPVPFSRYDIDNPEDLLREGSARIQAAVQYFADKNILNQFLIGHGLGAGAAAAFLSGADNTPVRAVSLISLDGTSAAMTQYLEKQALPVLDVYGSRDVDAVVNSAAERKRAVTQNDQNPHFRQVKLEGADHLYSGLEDALLAVVRGWLAKFAGNTDMPPGNTGQAR